MKSITAKSSKNTKKATYTFDSNLRLNRRNPFMIDLNNLEKLSLSGAVNNALMKANLLVQLEFHPSGSVVISVRDSDSKKVAGSIDDLKKLQQAVSIVARAKKEQTSSAQRESTMKLASVILSDAKKVEESTSLKKHIDGPTVVAIEALKKNFNNIKMHLVDLELNDDEASKPLVKPFKNFLVQIQCVIIDEIKTYVLGTHEKGTLKELLLKRGVPKYLYDRFCGVNIRIERSVPLLRTIYPNDYTKGLCFTVEELKTPGVFEFLGPDIAPFDRNAFGISLIRDPKMLQALSGLDDLGDESLPPVQSFLKKKVLIIPPKERGLTELIEARSKPGYKGTRVLQTTIGPDGDKLLPLLNAIFNYAHLFSPNMEVSRVIFSLYAPKLKLATPDLIKGNWYKQLHDLITREKFEIRDPIAEAMDNLIGIALNETSIGVKSELKEMVLKFSERAKIQVLIVPSEPVDYPAAIWTGTLDDFMKKEVAKWFEPAKGIKKDGRKPSYATPLTKAAKSFLREEDTFKDNPHLKEVIDEYLRGFAYESVQEVAVSLLAAKIREIEPDDDLTDSDQSESSEEDE